MKIPNGFDLLSMNPLWVIDDNGEITMIQNICDSENVIRVWDVGHYRDGKHYIDYPIEKSIMYIPKLGTIFFSTSEEAVRSASLTTSESGWQCLIDNAMEMSKHNKSIVEFDEYEKIENGIYSVSEFDECISSNWLNKIRYLDENLVIRKIKKSTEKTNFYIKKYISMFDFETRHDFEHERVLFEIYSEEGKVYINHIMVNSCNEPNDVFYYTRILNYPLFSSKKSALKYRDGLQRGIVRPTSKLIHNQYWITKREEQHNKRKETKEAVANLVDTLAHYAWNYFGNNIIKWGKAKLISLTKKEEE